MTEQSSIPEMINQSIQVITNPSVATFERYERKGTMVQAAIYVGIIAAITGLLGLSSGITGFIGGIINTLIGFFIFTGIVYYVGQQQGGTGTFDEVAYTFSLFWGPLSLIIALGTLILVITIIGIILVPVWLLAGLIASAYFAYLAVQSSMNLVDRNKILITLAAAVIGTWIVQALIAMLLG